MKRFGNVVLGISIAGNLVLAGLMLSGFTGPNVLTSFNDDVNKPVIAKSAFVHQLASVIGDVKLGEKVYVAPAASIRGDEGQSIYVGNDSNVQDGVVIHGLETMEEGKEIAKNQVEVAGRKYSVYVGDRVSMAHQSQVHGPALVGRASFIGMQALVFKATVGDGVVLGEGGVVVGGLPVDGVVAPARLAIGNQSDADALP